MSIPMYLQNLDTFHKKVLKILSRNEKILTDARTNEQTKERTHEQGMTHNPNLIYPPHFKAVLEKHLKTGHYYNEPRRDKRCLRGFRQSETQTSLFSYGE